MDKAAVGRGAAADARYGGLRRRGSFIEYSKRLVDVVDPARASPGDRSPDVGRVTEAYELVGEIEAIADGPPVELRARGRAQAERTRDEMIDRAVVRALEDLVEQLVPCRFRLHRGACFPVSRRVRRPSMHAGAAAFPGGADGATNARVHPDCRSRGAVAPDCGGGNSGDQ